jgi:predicted CoA-binding protein
MPPARFARSRRGSCRRSTIDRVHEPPILGVKEMEARLRSARTVAVLGVKPESRRHLDAHQIPFYLHKVGYRIIPVPTRYPDATHIFGAQVARHLADIAERVDIFNVFCKPADLAPWLPQIVSLCPGVVWFQSGLRPGAAAQYLGEAGIDIAEDCIGCRRASIEPSFEPLEGQAPGR